MTGYMVKVNETQRYEFYCVYFSDYCTGTMLKEQASKLIDWLQSKEQITLQEIKKVFRYSSIGLFYKEGLHRII